MFGNRLDMEMARRLGFVDAVLNRQIDELATSVSASRLGVAISDDLVRSVIVEEPNFKGLAGGFDRARFEQMLQAMGLSEAGYVEEVRRSVSSQQVLATLAAGATAPRAWVEAVYRYREETRTAESVFVADKDSGSGAEPTATQLQAFYEANKQTYSAPEYRALRFVRLDAAELAKEIELGDDVLKEAYERRADEFVTQEKRKVRQIIIPDEAKAKAAAKRLAEGADFLTVAKEDAGQEAGTVDLGEIVKGDLLGELADPVFAAKAGAVTQPLKSPLGWHIFQVVEVKPGGTQSFEQARDKLKKDLAHEKALDGLYELSNKFEDALGGGATIEEAAKQLNLKVEKLDAIDAEGLDRAGKPIEGLPAGGNFATTAFAIEEGADSAMTEAGESGFFILRVDKITKPALRRFEEVKDKVAEGWKAEERRKAAEARAKAIQDAVNAGTTLADVLAPTPLKLESSEPL
ncbi:MAG: peptidyl-prolyl cis-trans isomerase, partial [Rhodospirillaceae bacterium]